MKTLLNFKSFNMLESKQIDLQVNQVIDLRFEDQDGVHNVKAKLIEFGWGLDRTKQYHRFLVLDSDSNKFLGGAEFNLPMNFNKKEDTFLIYPHYNDVPGRDAMSHNTYTAYCEII